ncbi:MAG TPA: YciI family protein [Streptosporangiaceae bacterium]
MDLEAFELVLLRTPENAQAYDDDVLARNQREHLAYYDRLREAGQVVTNGPLADQPDPSWRGLAFYRTGSLAESRQLAEADPAVRAGRLAIEIMTWYCPPGTMSQHGRAVTLS